MSEASIATRACGLLAAVLLVACGTGERRESGAGPAAAAPAAAEALSVGRPVRGPLERGRPLEYTLDLAAGHFVEVAFDSVAVDAELVLEDPDGGEVARVESRAARWGAERLSAVSRSAGVHRLRVTPLGTAAETGELDLQIRRVRPGRPGDEARIDEERRFHQGQRLAWEDPRESKERALAIFVESAEIWRGRDDPTWRAVALFRAGVALKELDRLDEALALLEESGAIWREVGDEGWIAETRFEAGNGHALAGRYQEALAAYDAALPLFRQIGDRNREAVALNNQGWVYRRLADMQGALESYGAALDLARQVGWREREARGLVNLGTVYRSLGDPERALRRYQESLPIWRELGQRAEEARALNNMGRSLMALGEPEAAVEHFVDALGIARQLGYQRDQGSYLGNLGLAQLELGRPREALASCRQARELAEGAGDRRGVALRLHCLGAAHLALGALDGAERDLGEAAAAARALGDRTALAEARIALARLRREQGRLVEARREVEEALAIVEGVRTDVDLRSMRASFLAFHRDYYELEVAILMDLAGQRPDAGFAAEALAASERARARGLLELLGEAAAGLRARVDADLLRRERQVHEQINELALRDLAAGDAARRAQAERALEALLEEAEEIEGRIRSAHPRYAELAYPQPPALDQIRRTVLEPGTLLLEYSLGEEASFLWAVSRDVFEVHRLPPRPVIDAAARRVHELLSQPTGWRDDAGRLHAARLEEATADLSGMVLEPVAEHLRGQRLLIAPEGALSYVPFAALPAPSAAGERRLLVEDHLVVNVPSVSVLAAVRGGAPGRAPAHRLVMVFADPVFGRPDPRLGARRREPDASQPAAGDATRDLDGPGWNEFHRLRYSGEEARAIAELLPRESVGLRLGFAATREAAMAAETASYRVLHFATHGILDSRHPSLSGLVLSLVDRRGEPVDGVLRLHDIYDLDLRSDLVVLSACRTGLGKELRGEGLIGLTRGFLHAGARGVVASLWNVDDRATAELMSRFYRGLFVDRLAGASALRRAQLELLRGDAGPAWRPPYYWAAFVVHGDWRARPSNPETGPREAGSGAGSSAGRSR